MGYRFNSSKVRVTFPPPDDHAVNVDNRARIEYRWLRRSQLWLTFLAI